MHNVTLLTTAVTHQIYGQMYGKSVAVADRLRANASPDSTDTTRDRGAVSLEQVLWFVAAAVSVAVIAGVLWSQIKDKADDPITTPAAP